VPPELGPKELREAKTITRQVLGMKLLLEKGEGGGKGEKSGITGGNKRTRIEEETRPKATLAT